MQWSLFLLTLMGQCSFFTCRLYEYHFIKQNKSWSEAQSYCRDHYTDLATVLDETDVEKLRNTELNHDGAWIGLHSIYEENINKWLWSLPGVEFNNEDSKWYEGDPNDHGTNRENCVWMDNVGWKDASCDETHRFICYNATNETFHFIDNEKKKWQDAQSYCREHHTDLVSGHEQLNNDTFKKVISSNSATNECLWIGLFRDMWKWSDGSNSSFRNNLQSFNNDGMKCATTDSSGEWSSNDCNETKPFFCYDDNVILIKENMTWEDALYYCRDHHTDLVFITNSHQQRWVEKRASEADSPYVWTGLRYTCTLDFWFWVSDEVVIYKKWDSPDQTDECDMSGAMDRGGEHKWFKMFDHNEFNFICF